MTFSLLFSIFEQNHKFQKQNKQLQINHLNKIHNRDKQQPIDK